MKQQQQPRIGWIGTGVMGSAMCKHILRKGYPTRVYSRTKAKAAPLLEQGAQWCDSAAEVAQESDLIFTIVGFPADVEAVYLEPEGVFEGIRRNAVVVDMTTTKPSIAIQLHQNAEKEGAHFLDAPVSGGDVGAREGRLSIMVGGDTKAVERVAPIFDLLGHHWVHQGPAGSGQHTKMCNQIAIAGTMIGVCESLLYGYKAGLDLETMLSSICGGAAACWTLDNLAPRILQRNLDPGFFIDHFIKDMEIALEEAAQMDLALPGLALVNQLYRAVRAQGHGNKGTHALILALEQMSATEINTRS